MSLEARKSEIAQQVISIQKQNKEIDEKNLRLLVEIKRLKEQHQKELDGPSQREAQLEEQMRNLLERVKADKRKTMEVNEELERRYQSALADVERMQQRLDSVKAMGLDSADDPAVKQERARVARERADLDNKRKELDEAKVELEIIEDSGADEKDAARHELRQRIQSAKTRASELQIQIAKLQELLKK